MCRKTANEMMQSLWNDGMMKWWNCKMMKALEIRILGIYVIKDWTVLVNPALRYFEGSSVMPRNSCIVFFFHHVVLFDVITYTLQKLSFLLSDLLNYAKYFRTQTKSRTEEKKTRKICDRAKNSKKGKKSKQNIFS